MKDSMEFILALKNASLDDPLAKLSDDALDQLRNLPQGPIIINSPGVRQSISMYLVLKHGSQEAYNQMQRATMHNFEAANGAEEILSFYNVEKLIHQHTGVELIEHDMCPESCLAFTGPFAHLESCPIKVMIQTFVTILLGPQLQALYHDPENGLRQTGKVPVINDIAMGFDILGAVLNGEIKWDDIILMVSLDSAQLYESKTSNCWIYIWVVLNLSPDKCYRKVHVHPGGFIPGPNKPKNVDSFIIVGMHHLATLQRESLTIWDASCNDIIKSDLHLIFMTADGPGLVYWDGMVGHSSKNGCQMYCGLRGRHKTCGTHYYPVLLKPHNHCIAGSDHANIDAFTIPLGSADDYSKNLELIVTIPSQPQYELKQTETGLMKPPLIFSLSPQCCLSVLLCMTTDIMHLVGNLSDLLLVLWCGTMNCAPTDNINTWDWAILCDGDSWIAHGKAMEDAGPYFPGSFDWKPQNIAEKVNTNYKTWEFHLYIFSLSPALLYNVLPKPYWLNYTKLMRSEGRFQIMSQHSLSAEDLADTFILLGTWEQEFETLYYQLREDCLHFMRPCTHQTSPPICYAQWTMECTIGNLGQEIQQPSQPYCMVNTLLSTMPNLDKPHKCLSDTAADLGEDRYAKLPVGEEAQAISDFLGPNHPLPHIKKWSQLLLLNGQIARSAWREKLRSLNKTWMSCNVKLLINRQTRFAEVLYYMRLAVAEPDADDVDDNTGYHFIDIAIIQMYSPPDDQLLQLSSHTVVSCALLDEVSVVNVKKIMSVVTMIPHEPRLPSGITEDCFFMLEKPGLDIANFGIPYYENLDDNAEDTNNVNLK
ncbi:hypothetical protein BDR05DRAFT_972677 [Suillus weaverae]|nr:hypothetical protein BDR05DRAFT_972677 [Suillus weaverae]